MPELPEVECIARQLRRLIVGAKVTSASLHRADVLRAWPSAPAAVRGRRAAAAAAAALLADGVLVAVRRLGKQLALEVDDGRTLVLRLGMSGRIRIRRIDAHARAALDAAWPAHTHASWTLAAPQPARRDAAFELLFIDPRRFGGLAAFETFDSVRRACWNTLGPDALDLAADALRAAIRGSRRPIKSVLLDQSVVAGIGNIYADEILHRVGVHPLVAAGRCHDRADALASTTRRLLTQAIRLGGSTIRDYVNAIDTPGSFQRQHKVYGRVGEACLTCGERASRGSVRGTRSIGVIQSITLAGRTTSFCPICQRP